MLTSKLIKMTKNIKKIRTYDMDDFFTEDGDTDYYKVVSAIAQGENNPRIPLNKALVIAKNVMAHKGIDFDEEKFTKAWREFSKAYMPRNIFDSKTKDNSYEIEGRKLKELKKLFNMDSVTPAKPSAIAKVKNLSKAQGKAATDKKVKDYFSLATEQFIEKYRGFGIYINMTGTSQKLIAVGKTNKGALYGNTIQGIKQEIDKYQDSKTKDTKGKWHLEDDNEKIVSKEFDTEAEAKAEVLKRRKEAQTKGTKLIDVTIVQDSDYRGYKVTDQIIKGFMIYKSGKPNMFTAKNENGQQYEGTMEDIKAKIDAYWVKQDETVMKQKMNDSSKTRIGWYVQSDDMTLVKGPFSSEAEAQKYVRDDRHEGTIYISNPNDFQLKEYYKDTKDEKSSFGTKQFTMAELLKKAKQGELELYGDPKPRQHVQVRFSNGKTEMVWVEDSKINDKSISPRWRIKDDKIFKLKKGLKIKDAMTLSERELRSSGRSEIKLYIVRWKLRDTNGNPLGHENQQQFNSYQEAFTFAKSKMKLQGMKKGDVELNTYTGNGNSPPTKKTETIDSVSYKGYEIKEDKYEKGKDSSIVFLIYKNGSLKGSAESLVRAKGLVEKFVETKDTKIKDSLKKGDIVRFKNIVDPGDEKVKMQLLEDPDGGRVKVKAMPPLVASTSIHPISDLVKDSMSKDDLKYKKGIH